MSRTMPGTGGDQPQDGPREVHPFQIFHQTDNGGLTTAPPVAEDETDTKEPVEADATEKTSDDEELIGGPETGSKPAPQGKQGNKKSAQQAKG